MIPTKPMCSILCKVNESSYRFDQTLEPARYVWSVTAFDESGDKVGGTEIFDFTVRP